MPSLPWYGLLGPAGCLIGSSRLRGDVHATPLPTGRCRVPGRRFGVGEGLPDALVAQKRLPDAFPYGVLDRRVVGVLGRDEGRLLRLGEQFPAPLCQRTR